MPDGVADCDRRWLYALLHGDDEFGTGWGVSWLSPRQAADLLAALERDLPSAAGFDLVRLLRLRAAIGSPSG